MPPLRAPAASSFKSRRLAHARIQTWQTNDLEEHVALIAQQVQRGVDDPETIQLARKIVSGKPDDWWSEGGERWPIVEAWGEGFILPTRRPCRMRDDWCEIVAIWNFYVANVRYVFDPAEFDLFCTPEYTFKAGAGDCDDATVSLCALLKCIGFEGVSARIITTTGQTWEHVYAMVGLSKDRPVEWYALDPTVAGVAPGWQYDRIVEHRDFYL